MTRFEDIKNMNITETATFLLRNAECRCCTNHKDNRSVKECAKRECNCLEGTINWLNEEIPESGSGANTKPLKATVQEVPKRLKVYISGPITGVKYHRNKFERAEEEIRKMGLEPVNPDALPEGINYREALNISLKKLTECDMIYLLPGWELSRRARAEQLYAVAVEMPQIVSNKSEATLYAEGFADMIADEKEREKK